MSEFDEASYLTEHPDVLEAVIRGQFPSGKAHYEQYGRHEGRSLRKYPTGFLKLEVLQLMRRYVPLSEQVHGWCRGSEARELLRTSYQLPTDAVIVEIGCFLGSSTILLAGPRKARGSGVVHCVDPFDCSGDSYSAPIYRNIVRSDSARALFDFNIRRAGLSQVVVVHEGRAEEIGEHWITPIDLLFLDGDQSPQGVRKAYEVWSPFLKSGGTLVVHNSDPREYAAGHDGHRRLAVEKIKPPMYGDVRLVRTTTFAKKLTTEQNNGCNISLPHQIDSDVHLIEQRSVHL